MRLARRVAASSRSSAMARCVRRSAPAVGARAPVAPRWTRGYATSADLEVKEREASDPTAPSLGTSFEDALAQYQASGERKSIAWVKNRFKEHPEVQEHIERIESMLDSFENDTEAWDSFTKQLRFGKDDTNVDWDYVRSIIPNEDIIKAFQSAESIPAMQPPAYDDFKAAFEGDVKELYEKYQQMEEEATAELVQLQKEQKYLDGFVENLRNVTVDEDLKNEPEIAKAIASEIDEQDWDYQPKDGEETYTPGSLDVEALLKDGPEDDALLDSPPPNLSQIKV